ncbi:ribose 5-phosphate isomerase A [Salinicoccus sp. HZC-1]|uniref:ribose 5-phosphate isomerase A n=1 Tax=Salinicoccus sp. HZC-1 TaxID=3385497 RepID=UPI00398B7F31
MEKAFDYLNRYIDDGSVIGMGSGSTIEKYLPAMKKHIEKNGLKVSFLSTSLKTEKALKRLNLEVIFDAESVDVAIDGADQFNDECIAVKGGGGSLLREKQIDYFSGKIILIAHMNKKVEDFNKVPIPVEVNKYLYKITQRVIEETDASTEMRKEDGGLFVTDNDNYIIDCTYENISDLSELQQKLLNIPGVVETGIFDRYIEEIVSFDEQTFEILK